MKRNFLEVILKTVERCNINCTYCYYFNGSDNSFEQRSPYISQNVIETMSDFLVQGCKDFNYEEIQIDLHGGEPMMQKKHHFDAMCSLLRKKISPYARLNFSIQTNAILIDSEWIMLFEKHKINVGISLDGPKIYNDKERLDKKGRGTYDRVKAGVQKLTEAHKQGKYNQSISALCVINPLHDVVKIFEHFVDELGIARLDFLLPDYTHDSFPEHLRETELSAKDYGKYLCDLFDTWSQRNSTEIVVRIIRSTMQVMYNYDSFMAGQGPQNDGSHLLTISSDGELYPDDTLRSAVPELFQRKDSTIYNTSLSNFLSNQSCAALNQAQSKIPALCHDCVWDRICCGGTLVNRFGLNNGFDNPSIMCDGLKDFYRQVMLYLLKHGSDRKKLFLNFSGIEAEV